MVAELDHEPKGQSIIWSTEEWHEDVLTGSKAERSAKSTTVSPVDEQREVGGCFAEDSADEVGVHGRTGRRVAVTAAKNAFEGVQTISESGRNAGGHPFTGGRGGSSGIDGSGSWNDPWHNNELRTELIGVLGDGRREGVLTDDRNVRSDVQAS